MRSSASMNRDSGTIKGDASRQWMRGRNGPRACLGMAPRGVMRIRWETMDMTILSLKVYHEQT